MLAVTRACSVVSRCCIFFFKRTGDPQDLRYIARRQRKMFKRDRFGTHDIEIDIRRYIEKAQDLVKHLAMLGRGQHPAISPRLLMQGLDHGRHLDGLGPGAGDTE